MKCPNCGNECADGARFCTECGYKFPENTTTAEKEPAKTEPREPAAVNPAGARKKPEGDTVRKPPRRTRPVITRGTLIIAACAVAAVIIIIATIAIAAAVGKNSGYTEETVTRYASLEAYLLVDNHGRCYDLSEYEVASFEICTSLNGKTAAVLGKKHPSDKNGVLLLICDEKLSKIADGVYDCAVSDNGASVAYVTAGDDTGTLYLYNVKKQTAASVSGGIPYESLASLILGSDITDGMFVLSPDGRSIAFTKVVNNGTRAYVSVKGSEPIPVAADSYPIAISNGAKYIYYIKRNISLTDYNYKFTVECGDEVRNLSLDALHLGDGIIFNRDRTEVIFSDDGATYISRKGAERQKLMTGTVDGIIVPGDGAARREIFSFLDKYVDIYARKTIGGSIFVSGGGLYCFDSAFEVSVITSSYGGASVAPNGRSLYYIDTSSGRNGRYGSVYFLGDIEKNGSKALVSASLEAVDISAADDAGGVYVYDIDRTLWFVGRNGKKQKRIYDEVEDWCVDVNGGVWFTSTLEDSDTVWYSAGGSKKKAVAKSDISAVMDGNFMPRSVFYTLTSFSDSGTHVEVRRVKSGKRWETVAEYDIQD